MVTVPSSEYSGSGFCSSASNGESNPRMRKLLSVDDCHIIHSPGSTSAGERSASDSELGYQSWGADEDYGGDPREERRILLFRFVKSGVLLVEIGFSDSFLSSRCM